MRTTLFVVLGLCGLLLTGVAVTPQAAPSVAWPPMPEDQIVVGDGFAMTNVDPAEIFTVPSDKWLIVTYFHANLLPGDTHLWELFYTPPSAIDRSLVPSAFVSAEPEKLPLFKGMEVGLPVPPGSVIKIKSSDNNPTAIVVLMNGYLVDV